MHAIRHLLAQRRFAALLCAATLLLKLLVPAGMMLATDHGRIALTICSGVAPVSTAMAMHGMGARMGDHGKAGDHGKSGEHGKMELPCAFAGLSAAMTGAVDPIQLAALIVFILAVGLAGVLVPAPFSATHLRPPLRGPPSYR